MRQQSAPATVTRSRDYARDYEYLVLSVPAQSSKGETRKLITEHAEYGKWELERTRLYSGGGRRYWLRRRVMRIQRTV